MKRLLGWKNSNKEATGGRTAMNWPLGWKKSNEEATGVEEQQ